MKRGTGRIRGRRNLDDMLRLIDAAMDRPFGTIEATAITLFKSDPQPGGTIHTPTWNANLG